MDLKFRYVKIKILLTISGIFFLSGVSAQDESGFFKLNRPVKLWVMTHPFSACQAKKIAEKAKEKTTELRNDPRLDGFENGGQLDAFRHAYWMALMSQKYNCRKAYSLGRAHEKGNVRDFKKRKTEEGELPDSVSVEMDLHNNCVGVFAGFENPGASEAEMTEIIIRKILKGEMLIIKRAQIGHFLDCEDRPIADDDWRGIWNNKRCLVRSGFKPPEN